MTTTLQPPPVPSLPPSPRDLLAYQRIVLEFASTRQTADDLKISQTRVRQIVRRVADWLAETLPQPDEARDATHLRLAQHIAADRLDSYLREAHHAWRQTHESKYMTTILRLMAALSKLPAHPGTLEALAADITAADAIENVVLSRREGQEAEDAIYSQDSSPTKPASKAPPSSFSIHPSSFSPPPPPGDCSPAPTPALNPPAKNQPKPLLTPVPTTPSATPRDTRNPIRQAFLAPAHPTPDASITELKITPQSIGLSPPNHSNRRERRRLKRLLSNK